MVPFVFAREKDNEAKGEEKMKRTHEMSAIKEFPHDGRAWMLAWVGEIHNSPRSNGTKQIEVSLLPLQHGRPFDKTAFKTIKNFSRGEAKKVRVSIGLLPALILGSGWINGFHQPTSHSPANFPNLQIDPQTVRIADSSNLNAALINPENYQPVRECLSAKYLVIDHDGDIISDRGIPWDPKSKILIPCSEIVRFYYSFSSQLGVEIISGGLHTKSNDVFNPHLTRIRPDGRHFIQLRRRILNIDAPIVARLAFCPVADKWARAVHGNLQLASVNNTPRVLETSFPFVGSTNLSTQGKWIHRNGLWHFLVLRILSCTSVFPFLKLDHDRDNPGIHIPSPEPLPPSGWTPEAPSDIDPDTGLEIADEGEPSPHYSITEETTPEHRFPYIAKCDIRKVETTENQYQGHRPNQEEIDPPQNFSAGGKLETSREAKVSIHPDGKDNDKENSLPTSRRAICPASYEAFVAHLEDLERRGGGRVHCRLRQVATENEIPSGQPTSFFPVYDRNVERHRRQSYKPVRWAFMDDALMIRRQAMIGEIQFDEKYFYLFDAEVLKEDPDDHCALFFVFARNFARQGDGVLTEVLQNCTNTRGDWIEKPLVQMRFRTFRHNLASPKRYGFRTFRYICSLLGVVSGVRHESGPGEAAKNESEENAA